MMTVILSYIVTIQVLGYGLMYLDKRCAMRGTPRVPERMIFAVGLMGGFLGVWWAMKRCRHKTKKESFINTMSAISVLYFIALVALFIL